MLSVIFLHISRKEKRRCISAVHWDVCWTLFISPNHITAVFYKSQTCWSTWLDDMNTGTTSPNVGMNKP